ncbi:MAG: hypothetical protein RLN70_07385, partial [Rhodospirillaceae bacterium]
KGIVESFGDVSGKVIIDLTNGLEVTGGRFEAPPDQEFPSNGELVQATAKGAHVVKAFNSLSREIMEDPNVAGGPVTVSLAGDNAEAKARVAEIAKRMELVPLDVGDLYLSRYLEGMARLRIAFRARHRPSAIEFHLPTYQT